MNNSINMHIIRLQFLQTEALRDNPKLEVFEDGLRFSYKPVYKLKDGKSLLKLLKQQDLKGLGGVMLDDIQESLPHCDKVLKARANEIVYITRPTDKKKILFYNDRSANLNVSFIGQNIEQLYPEIGIDYLRFYL